MTDKINEKRLGLQPAQGDTTGAKATDQLQAKIKKSDVPRKPLPYSLQGRVEKEKALAKVKSDDDYFTATHWEDQLKTAGVDKWMNSQAATAYEIHWDEFKRNELQHKTVTLRKNLKRKAELARLSEATAKVQKEEETKNLFVALTQQTGDDGGISMKHHNGMQIEQLYPGTTDFVSLSNLQPTNWWEGLDRHNGKIPRSFKSDPKPALENACTTQKSKQQGGDSVRKAHAIAGYLKRKALTASNKVDTSKLSNVTSKLRAAKTVEQPDRDLLPVGNRFILVEDEMDSNAEEGTQEPDAPESVEGKPVALTGCKLVGNRRPSGSTLTGDQDNEKVDGEVACGGSKQKTKMSGVIPEGQSPYFHQVDPPSFSKARLMRDKKSRKAYTALTYYLKCKHFMHVKDPHFIRTLVQDARAWLLRGQFKMETYQEYVILTSAVMSAFFVDQEELHFRARMKNRTEWQALDKHNRACAGDLGWRFGKVEPRFNAVRHVFQSRVRLPVNNAMSA